MRIGVIGLGNIGGPIAVNLLADGHTVTVHDLDPARCASLTGAGAQGAEDPPQVARNSEVTLLSLPTPDSVDQVAESWLEGAARDDILVDLSTNAPDRVRGLGKRLEASGFHLLEAPLTGGAPGAKRRMLVFLVGGDDAIFARCRPILEQLGQAVFHMGALGSGNTTKLVNSLLAFTSTWVSLEGLAIAAKAGIDLRVLVSAVRTGGAGNFYIDRMVEGINQRGRPTQFALGLAAKDAGLILDVARDLGVPTPVASSIAQVLVSSVAAGLADADWSDLVELIERQADVKLALGPAPD